MFKPKRLKAKDAKYCTNCIDEELEPHVKRIDFAMKTRTFIIDFWFCPECGATYYFKDWTSIVEKNEVPMSGHKMLNKETGKYEHITDPKNLPATSWAETMVCAGDEKRLEALWEKRGAEKEAVLKELEKTGKWDVEEYYKVKKRMGL